MNQSRRLALCVLCFMCSAVLAICDVAVARDTPALLLQQASELLDAVKPADTSYQHQGGEVRWPDKATGCAAECHTDCSGLIDALFQRAYGLNRSQFADWMKAKRPLAKHYHDTIIQQRGFQAIQHVADAQPGDLLAIAYPPGGENTGHVMLVAGKPRLLASLAPR